MRWQFALQGSVGSFACDYRLEGELAPWTGVLGPSGAGKSTLLRALAGLEPQIKGRFCIGADELAQDGARGMTPPERRLGLVFQDTQLFPHRDVLGNLRFALDRARAVDGPSLEQAIEWFGLQELLPRRTQSLSGGEKQRVAIARAVLSRPRMLLLDEPVSALDQAGREEVLQRLEAFAALRTVPVLHVSHGFAEVARLAEVAVWVEGGRIVRAGPIAELALEPGFAERLGEEAGALIAGVLVEHDAFDQLARVHTPLGDLWLRKPDRPLGASVRLRLRARDLSLAAPGQGPRARGSILNALELRVLAIDPGRAGEVLVRLGIPGAPPILAAVTERSRRELGLAPGQSVEVRVKAVSLLA